MNLETEEHWIGREGKLILLWDRFEIAFWLMKSGKMQATHRGIIIIARFSRKSGQAIPIRHNLGPLKKK
jgi:hypothetical protein